MDRRETVLALLALGAAPLVANAQQVRIYRVGVVLLGGSYLPAIDGLRDGLKKLGLEEGKQFVLHLRDTKGDLTSVDAVAKELEDEKVDVIFAVARSVTTAARRGTKRVPIVFYSGTDPVTAKLVESFAKPGGRLTGIYGRNTDLTGKRLELLKAMVPTLRRVVTFYNSASPATGYVLKLARDAAHLLKIELVERPVKSVEELRAGVRAIRRADADAFCYLADAMVISQSDLIIDAAKEKRMATIFADPATVAKGALASYGQSYRALGRLAAKHVQQILLGADPASLPVEQIDRLYFAINLKTAKAIGITIPQSVQVRADEIIR